jgi:dUTP pyrophosphatase
LELKALVKKLRPDALLPASAHGPREDAGFDLRYIGDEAMVLAPGARAAFPTGIAIELPPGFEGQIRPRSGLALTRGVTVLNAPGTIDPGFRGEITVLLINLSSENQRIEPGDRIAQLVVAQYAQLHLEERESLESSGRGEGGFGSTGA